MAVQVESLEGRRLMSRDNLGEGVSGLAKSAPEAEANSVRAALAFYGTDFGRRVVAPTARGEMEFFTGCPD